MASLNLQDRTCRIIMASSLYIAACNGNEEEVRILLTGHSDQ